MPKYCALIKRVESIPIFKLHIQWLETCTKPKGLLHWLDTKMPTCVGVFSGGDEAEFDETTSFSHLMKGAAAVQENRYEIFPRKGEVWAIYRNFSSEWSSDDLQTCEYDIGEVIEADGTIKVLVLEKVSDYKTVFKAQTKVGCESVLVIPHRQAIRFSHQIPAFQLTDEKEGTLRGCWELDPDGMPVCLFNSISSTLSKETSCADQACSKEIESDGVGSKPNILAKQSPHGPLHLDSCGFTKAQYSTLGEPQKRINSEKEHIMVGRRQLIEHTSSSRLADAYKEKRSEETSGLPLCKRKTATVSVGKKICDGPTVGSENTAKKISPHGVNTTIPVSVDEEIPSSPSPLKVFEKQETEFCNFDDERSCEKFKTGQVWALYCKLDEMPKSYALIESVESYPNFKLAVKWLKSSNPPRGVIPWVDKEMPVCCGIFKVVPGEGVVVNNTIAFSHQLSGVAAGNNLYTICPRVGEVWALYSKFCPDMMCADLKNCEYYMVEVLEVVDARWIIVSVLQSVTSFKTVFNAKGKEGLESFALAIPWVELYRFSHQVPGLKLTEARYGKLRGCWELDPRSMPVSIL
ncbi:hypothetical protein MKW94_012177 [Papaver nudicaule]|uniref:DUF3444 domain-containing protein n=1 Tax=Papaver nudicaule TaxID=74823 RepID=A0AA41V1M4_PAPNU|nr:hypothetical protein [Papaver nudicaule]